MVGLIDANETKYYNYGVKSLKTKEAVDEHSVFEICSISKTFIGLLLADMVLREELKLDDPLQKYLPKDIKAPTRNGETIKLLHMAIHTSSFSDGSYGGQPGGFVISADDKNIYIAGDTALTMDMKLIPMSTKLDLAILPIGDNFTMGIDDAIIASDFVECDNVLGCHYDTFGYIEIDHIEAVGKFEKESKTLHLLAIGESLTM